MRRNAEGIMHYPEVNVKMTIPAASRSTTEKVTINPINVPLKARLGAAFMPKREKVNPTEEKMIAPTQKASIMAK